MASPNKKLRVVELFAGVGGFRLGLEGYMIDTEFKSASSDYKEPMPQNFKVIWSNQFEPLTPSNQHASKVYMNNWPDSVHSDRNIELMIDQVPDHDVLVGGFPCQDYSVATTLKNSKGLVGKKGVLWWSIYNIIKNKAHQKRPSYLILENVDRLLASPAQQRGRDFAVMLCCLNELGYNVEWRVINASDYGMPQRRRRVFIIAYSNDKNNKISKKLYKSSINDWICSKGVLPSAFKIDRIKNEIDIFFKFEKDWLRDEYVSSNFNKKGKTGRFLNSGVMVDGVVYTHQSHPITEDIYPLDIIISQTKKEGVKIPSEYIIDENETLAKNYEITILENGKWVKKSLKTKLELWRHLKGSKTLRRKVKKTDDYYKFSEGKMDFPDNLNKPSRTIVTGEGGKSPSRFKHVIEDEKLGLRRLIPIELERLNMFPKDHTKLEGVTDAKRAFFMGNALVVGVVERIGKQIAKLHNES